MDDPNDPLSFTYPDASAADAGPSLPIILISAVVGVGCGIFGLYVAYQLLFLIAPVSAGLGTLALLTGIGVSAAVLGRFTDSQATLLNMGISCGVVFFAAIFFGFCLLIGAITATFTLAG